MKGLILRAIAVGLAVLVTAAGLFAAPPDPCLRVILSLPNMESFFQTLLQGGKEARAYLGIRDVCVELAVMDAQNSLEKQIVDLEHAVAARRVDALILYPIDGDGLASLVQDVTASGIPVLVVGHRVVDAPHVAVIRTDYFMAGIDAAVELINLLRRSGKRPPCDVVILEGKHPVEKEWGKGVWYILDPFIEEGSVRITADIQEIEIDFAMFTSSEAKQVMEDLLQANPEIDAVIASNDGIGVSAIEGIVERGFTPGFGGNDIIIISLGLSGFGIQRLREFTLPVVVAGSPLVMGFWAVEAVVKYVRKEWTPQFSPFFLRSPAPVLTLANVDQVTRVIPSLPVAPVIKGDYGAILVGTDYKENERWTEDAKLLHKAMMEWENWKRGRVQLVLNPTATDISNKLAIQADPELGSGPDTMFLFYYSGHGSNPVASNNVEPVERGLPLNECEEVLSPLKGNLTDDKLTDLERWFHSGAVVLNVIDACYSGGFWGGNDEGDLERAEQVLLTSVPEDRTSMGDSDFSKCLAFGAMKGHSQLPKGIAMADSDYPIYIPAMDKWVRGRGNGDGMITIQEWFDWTSNCVRKVIRDPEKKCAGHSSYDESDEAQEWFASQHNLSQQPPEESPFGPGGPGGPGPSMIPQYYYPGCYPDTDPGWPNPFGNVVVFHDQPTWVP